MARGLDRLLQVTILTILVATFFCPNAGCENKKTGSDPAGFPMSFADLAEAVKPAVVNISTVSTVKIPGNPFQFFFGQGGKSQDSGEFDAFLKKFFGDIPDRELKQRSLGSGVIIDKVGYILTNYHVVQRAADITVRLTDGREFKAKVIGRDSKSDLSLIKISSPAQDLPVLPLGDSDRMRVGDWVLAVGNPFGLAHTVTQGIISATGRVIGTGPYDNFLQTDAPVNPGNSGGPLVNLRGEVVGITTAIVATGQGIGFAIPSNMAKNVVNQLREKGKVIRGWIGVSVQAVTPEIAESFGMKERRGALIGDVVPEGPAQAAGLRRGDIIVRFNNKDIKTMTDLPLLVAQAPVGSTVPVTILREGKEMNINLKIGELPEEKTAAPSKQAVRESDFGMSLEDITPSLQKKMKLQDKTGVVVIDVAQGSPAEDAGIEAGDVIKEVNRTPVKNLAEYKTAVAKIKKGSPILLLLKRGAMTFYASLKDGE
ncbi:MAG: putative periplasmic serine endoprotease DegP-like precursor [Syntrophorhabdaceae bacterium PtaU1.Bin034]|nr:MAG: putative periplasmic serine endoprotease DegP-like precursor [Syntrophorhabdaceae bacterium PtaU1.Bin034]